MSYCLNPVCENPHNPDRANYCQTCGSALQLGDRYRALNLLGQGGFGRTFLAVDEDEATGRSCVIKQLLLRDRGVPTEKAAALFRQEAERLADLGQHPQIPQLFAHFELENAQYLVQDYIHGQTLEDMLAQNGRFDEPEIRDLLTDLLPVLEFIHSQQVIHRDIKPANIIRPHASAHYVLVDFGASKYVTGLAPTRTGTVIGSAGYVAPEQAMGKAEFASDLYSLGVTCVHLLTGLHPFDLYSVSEDAWIWRSYLARPISRRLRHVLDTLLQKATNQRYRSAEAVLADLQEPAHARRTIRRSQTPPVQATRSRTVMPAAAERTRSTTLLPATWESVQTLTDLNSEVTTLALSPRGKILASGSRDSTIKLWRLSNGELLHTFPGRWLWKGDGHQASITALAFVPDAPLLISGSDDGTLKFWDLTTCSLIKTVQGAGWGISALTLSQDGQYIVSGSHDGVIQLWDRDRDQWLATLTEHRDRISALLIDAKARTLVSSSYDKTIRLWNLRTQTLNTTVNGHTDRVGALALTPDGYTLISGSWDKTLKLWDFKYQEQLKVWAAHREAIHCLAVHPNSKICASGSEDGSIKLWDLKTGDRLSTLQHAWGVNAIVFSRKGEWLVSGSADETIKIWQRMPLNQSVRFAEY